MTSMNGQQMIWWERVEEYRFVGRMGSTVAATVVIVLDPDEQDFGGYSVAVVVESEVVLAAGPFDDVFDAEEWGISRAERHLKVRRRPPSQSRSRRVPNLWERLARRDRNGP